MPQPRAEQPFRLVEYHTLSMPTGIRVRDAVDLLDAIQDVPDSVLARHFQQCYLQPDFDASSYPNSFAEWAAYGLQEPTLAEELSTLDPYNGRGWDHLRRRLEEVLEQPHHQFGAAGSRRARFDLVLEDAVEFIVETDREAYDLAGLTALVADASLGSVFHHVHGGAFRNRGRDDFSVWVAEDLQLPIVADTLAGIDFPYYGLAELRRELVATLDAERAHLEEART